MKRSNPKYVDMAGVREPLADAGCFVPARDVFVLDRNGSLPAESVSVPERAASVPARAVSEIARFECIPTLVVSVPARAISLHA
jgi:hypothetical protein